MPSGITSNHSHPSRTKTVNEERLPKPWGRVFKTLQILRYAYFNNFNLQRLSESSSSLSQPLKLRISKDAKLPKSSGNFQEVYNLQAPRFAKKSMCKCHPVSPPNIHIHHDPNPSSRKDCRSLGVVFSRPCNSWGITFVIISICKGF